MIGVTQYYCRQVWEKKGKIGYAVYIRIEKEEDPVIARVSKNLPKEGCDRPASGSIWINPNYNGSKTDITAFVTRRLDIRHLYRRDNEFED